mmetsp:Transcript_13896/g.21072  ORF Transcript_13896/g.21072 Transcript_13896/m.21072 type:complete len:230 (-) Transcript_13896:409-1098(-)
MPGAKKIDKEEENQQILLQHESAEARLAAALDVNRSLHKILAEKTAALEQSQEAVSLLEARVHGRTEFEEPHRKARLEELHEKIIQTEASHSRIGDREANLLKRQKHALEAKVLAMNESNVQLAEKHRKEREQVSEKQHKLRIQGKTERELVKQLDIISRELSEAAVAACEGTDLKPVDYRCLPGLNVSKLVGKAPQREPPTLKLNKDGGLSSSQGEAGSGRRDDGGPH